MPGGVLSRAGHTEAGCDLARMAGLTPASVICEIMKDDGTMARLADLERFAVEHGLKIGTIADLIHYRSRTEKLVERVAERPLATAHGAFRLVVYREKLTEATHLALVRGPISADTETLVRVHEPLSVMDLLDAQSESHSWSIPAAMEAIARAGRGVIVLLHRPESAEELRRRAVSAEPPLASKMDLRNYGIGAQILRDLNVGRMRILARAAPHAQHDRLRPRGDGLRRRSGAAGVLTMALRRIIPRTGGAERRVGVVVSRFNAVVCDGLLAGALRALRDAGVDDGAVTVASVPGALETPQALQRLAQSGEFDALVALGAVIRGETYHFEIVSNESARGVAEVALQFGVPIGNGILTCDTDEQALARMDAKGYEAAQAALELANLFDDLDED